VTEEVHHRILEGIVQTINDEYILVVAAGAAGTIASVFLTWKGLSIDSNAIGEM
jgi:NCAIR mutase (PurE)-related protein